MESDIKIRFKALLSYLKMGQGQFEEKCKLSNGTINNMKKSVTSINIEKIMNVFPELNIEWLISGKGEMIKGENNSSNEEIINLKANIEYLETNIEMWQKNSMNKEMKINKLETENKILTEKIKRLESKEAM